MVTIPVSKVSQVGFQMNRPPATFDPEHDLAPGFLEFLTVGIEPARASLGLRFAGPPDNPGQPVFPGPVRNLGISSLGLPSLARFKR
jgi:hypothetical protein